MRVAVTGAFGYSGKYIAKRLLGAGHDVFTLTNSVRRENPFGAAVHAVAFHFDEPAKLEASLRGTEVLINTYWVRFDHRRFTHDEAVRNSRTLFRAAKAAEVRRVVHVSIANPDSSSDLPYFRGKAEIEAALRDLGVPSSILRPAFLFGKEDVLVNNIAWSIRRLPVFGVFGAGEYRLQPIYVDDLAAAAVDEAQRDGDRTIEAIGPEIFTYRSLAETIRDVLGVRCPIVSVPPAIGYASGRLLDLLLRDVVVTREEIRGLMEGRLCVDAPPLGTTRLTEWVREHRDALGRRYTSEMARRIDRESGYRSN